MNERYTTDKKSGGTARRSAAKAKPKAGAGSTVTTVKKTKKPVSRAEKRQKNKEQRNKDYENERKYGDPKTKKFKTLKKLWIGGIILSVCAVGGSYLATQLPFFPEGASLWFLGAAYIFIIATLYIDLGQIRKERKRYAAAMASVRTKENRAQQKAEARALRDAKKKAEEEKKRRLEAGEDITAQRSKLPFVDKLKTFFSNK